MGSTQTNVDLASPTNISQRRMLVSLTPQAAEALEITLDNLAVAFSGQTVLVLTPDQLPSLSQDSPLRFLPYTSAATSTVAWVHTAADYLNIYKLLQEHQAAACLMLGGESHTLPTEALKALAKATTNSDLAVARYNLGSREGLVNSAILYPITRALFAARPRFPLAIDIGVSPRMAERLAAEALRLTSANQNEALIWPVAAAATANYSITEIDAGDRILPAPAGHDLNALLAQIAGSLFQDVDAKATYWQRARSLPSGRFALPPNSQIESPSDITPMLDAFQLAYTNLHEIWSLVLPPNSLLGLKRLSALPTASFRMPDSLWARIIYDFILAYRLRTINRGHLLGALTPLYLAWVASHLLLIGNGTPPEKHIEELAAVFETEKPYLVSRWRWPDRFNP